MSIVREVDHGPNGFVVTAFRERRGLLGARRERVPVPDWEAEIVEGPIGRTTLRRLLETGGASEAGDGLVVSDDAAAALDAVEARAIGLPEPVPLPLQILTRDQIASDGFRVWSRFVDANGQAVASRREGSAVRLGDALYRMPRPLREIDLALADVVRARDRDERIAAVARVRSLLPEDDGGGHVRADPFLDGITLLHAHTFGLDVRKEGGDVTFDPIALGAPREGFDAEADGVDPPPLLDPEAAAAFAGDFRARGAADVHVLGSGNYLFIDPALRPSLRVVARKQRAPVAERLVFVQHPERELEREIGEAATIPVDDIADEPRSRFVATVAYSERVVEIGEWVPPDLPFIKNAPSTWLPERFCVILGGAVVTLQPTEVGAAKKTMREALARGDRTAMIGGVEVSVSPETVETIEKLPETMEPPEEPDPSDPPEDGDNEDEDEPPAPLKLFLSTHTNHHAADFDRSLEARDLSPGGPAMRSTLREHQIEALDWMRACWRAGRPGVLLADDMGLGKTIEVLSFLSALREGGEERPFLIVAPTSLLDNWTSEHGRHLSCGLGKQVTAYGGGLRALRDEVGREHELGRALLSGEALGNAGFVLTTYETLRDYQFSFAPVEFAVAVYDETQKVKNPKSRMAASAKSIKADFSIAMTGTPVENAMADLWSITDLVSPGMLPPLREFHRDHTAEQQDNLVALRDYLLKSQPDGTPPFALRRLKSEVVSLPPLHERTLRAIMEGDQALAYQETVNRAVAGGGRERLRVLHDMRSISLHPVDPKRHPVPDDEAYIAGSARMREAFKVLDAVKGEGAKAIVFLQSHKVQDILSDLIERRYGLARAPRIIRGDTPASRRQSFIDDFSAEPGFGVIVLSPRAAGVGLNVTAATHVIHLDRWWNPAVEDQCTARAYRIGQDREVTVHYPMAIHPAFEDSSYDVVLDAILTRKRDLSRSLFVPVDLSPVDFDGLARGATGGPATPGNGDDRTRDLALVDERGSSHLEAWVESELRREGVNVAGTPQSGDGGADVIVRDRAGTITHIIQCKHTIHPDRPVPESTGILRDLQRAGTRWGAPGSRFVAVTNAREFAPAVRSALVDAGALVIERENLHALSTIIREDQT